MFMTETEEIVSYKLACMAAKAGFLARTTHYYDGHRRLLRYKSESTNYNRDDMHGMKISAPGQAVLQRWLRRHHDLIVSVIPMGDPDEPENLSWSWSLLGVGSEKDLDSHEVALGEGLYAALCHLLKNS